MSAEARLVVHAGAAWIEKLVTFFLGSRAIGIRRLAEELTDERLARFPPADLAEADEHNARLLEEERATEGWQGLFRSIGQSADVDEARFETLCCQRFILLHGRRMSQIRQLLRLQDPEFVVIATDLPTRLVDALLAERYWGSERLRVQRRLSAALRGFAFVDALVRLTRLHTTSMIRVLQSYALPVLSKNSVKRYAVWLGANPAEMASDGAKAFSLPEFLADALSGNAVEQIVVQCRNPSRQLPAGVVHRSTRYPMRWRPRLWRLTTALAQQTAMLARDLIRMADWRHRELIAPVLAPLPGTRLWLASDTPAAVLYANSMIGAEPIAAAVGPRVGVETMMVFYSVNVACRVPPGTAKVATDLEPEMRYIAAGKLGMWSVEMRRAFEAAGYSASRLPVTGVVHYGRQNVFRCSSQFTCASRGSVRIGVFDVSVLNPALRFLTGWGQTIYHSHFCREYFSDLVDAARGCWGNRFVLVRKLKRTLDPAVHVNDLDLSDLLPHEQLVDAPPNANLWHLLGELDLVVCMPFTSVTFMAEQYGIPAAYYDPLGTVKRSSLAGRAPLLSGKPALLRWLRDPACGPAHDPSINVASETLKAACGLPWRPPALRERQPSA